MSEKEKILVLDDQPSFLRKIKKILGSEYDLTPTISHEEAIKAVKSISYVLVILDWNLKSGIDGIDVLIEMRKSVPDLRAVMLTNYDKSAIAVASIYAGALDYITKLPLETLAPRLKYAINKHKRTKLTKVFLSYERKDIKIVSNLRRDLSIQGFLPWQDTEEIRAGKFQPQIRDEINNSDFFIACLSPNLINKTGFVQREIKWALEKQEEFPENIGYIIPVRLVDCEIPKSLKDFQAVDLFKEDGFIKLVRMLL